MQNEIARLPHSLPIIARAVLSQSVGIGAGAAAYMVGLHVYGSAPDTMVAALLGGGAAGLAGHFVLRMPSWWIFLNSLFLPGLWLGTSGGWPGWIFGILFFATLVVFWNVARDRVPLYLSNQTTAAAVAELMAEESFTGNAAPRRFCDLGSGLGSMLVGVGRLRTDWACVGYESAPMLYLLSAMRLRFAAAGNVTIDRHDFWTKDLSSFDVVYAFLSPAPMARLYEKVKAEMRPGSLFISNSFEVPGEAPDTELQLADRRQNLAGPKTVL